MAIPKRRELLEPMISDLDGTTWRDEILDRLIVKLTTSELEDLPTAIRASLNKSIGVFYSQYMKKITAANGNLDEFMKTEMKWLDSEIYLDDDSRKYFSDATSVIEQEIGSSSLKCENLKELHNNQGNNIQTKGKDDRSDLTQAGDCSIKSDDPNSKLKTDDVMAVVPEDDKCEKKNEIDTSDQQLKEENSESEEIELDNKRKHNVLDSDIGTDDEHTEPTTRRRRGRPKGSKNRSTTRLPRECKFRRAKRSGSPVRRVGRPNKPWEELSGRSKQRASKVLLSGHSTEELLIAAAKTAQREGRLYLVKAINHATIIVQKPEYKPEKKWPHMRPPPPIPYNDYEAVCINVEQDLPKRAYQELRLSALTKNAAIYPPYNRVKEAKIACYPDGIQVNHNVAEVPLQALLNHTSDRILHIEKNDVAMLKPNDDGRLKLILSVKWGSDGSSGSSEWRQRFLSDSLRESNDADLFCTSLVPLSLKCGEDMVWQNPTPSSVRFCRPLSIQLGKETPEMAFEAQVRVESQIRELKPYSTSVTVITTKREAENLKNRKSKKGLAAKKSAKLDPDYFLDDDITIKDEEEEMVPTVILVDVFFHVQQTVINPTMVSAITANNVGNSCHICCSKPDPFDQRQLNAAALQAPSAVNPESFKHILSPLHAWVISFECLIHLACFLPQGSWNNRTDIATRVTQRKTDIQRGFKNELGLVVDKPRSGVTVSTNEANTAKKAFQSEEEFSRITGVDQGLIHRFNVILSTLSSEYEINTEEFGLYCQTTSELFNALYHWFNMPLVIHKLLHHGAQVIQETILPIGMMSEEAQKARNKGYKPFFLRHAKKESKENAMLDVMKYLMVTGDPIMSVNSLGLRKARQCWKSIAEVTKLLRDPKNPLLIPKREYVKKEQKEPKVHKRELIEADNKDSRNTDPMPADLSMVTADPSPEELRTDDPGPSEISFQPHDNSNPAFSIPISNIAATYQHTTVPNPQYHAHTSATYQYAQIHQSPTKLQTYTQVHHAPTKLQTYNHTQY